jgi:hypothetical protein
VVAGTLLQFRDDCFAQMAAGAADSDFHSNLLVPDSSYQFGIAAGDTCFDTDSRGGYPFSKDGILRCEPSIYGMGGPTNA